MERRGRVVLAWPEDRLLVGEELDQLTMELADYGNQVNALITDGNAVEGYPEEAFDTCEQALIHALQSMGATLSIRDLTDTVIGCWERNDLACGVKLSADDSRQRRSLLSGTLLDAAELDPSTMPPAGKMKIDVGKAAVSLSVAA